MLITPDGKPAWGGLVSWLSQRLNVRLVSGDGELILL
jgi:hypothetical protein